MSTQLSNQLPTQLYFDFAKDKDPNYCPYCKGYTRISPTCHHRHKLSKLVLFIKCDHCYPGDSHCAHCGGEGYRYEIIDNDKRDITLNEMNGIKGRIISGIFVPVSNRL